MKINYIVGIIVLLVIAILGWLMLYGNKPQVAQNTRLSPTSKQIQATNSADMAKDQDASSAAVAGNAKEIIVEGSKFKFVPAEIKIKKGDRIKIIFKNTDGMHNFVLPEFNLKTKVISSGAAETVELVADKAGTFEYYCSVGNHKAMGMKGNLIVE